MKKLIYTLLALASSLPLLCQSTDKLPNGWYHITNPATMTIDKTPIVTAANFESLEIDSMRQSLTSNDFPEQVSYMISGQVNKAKIKDYADATEKAIGKQIGFLYNGEIIVAPQPMLRIDDGRFSITPSYYNDRDKMMQLFGDLRKEMRMNSSK